MTAFRKVSVCDTACPGHRERSAAKRFMACQVQGRAVERSRDCRSSTCSRRVFSPKATKYEDCATPSHGAGSADCRVIGAENLLGNGESAAKEGFSGGVVSESIGDKYAFLSYARSERVVSGCTCFLTRSSRHNSVW